MVEYKDLKLFTKIVFFIMLGLNIILVIVTGMALTIYFVAPIESYNLMLKLLPILGSTILADFGFIWLIKKEVGK